MSAIEEPVAVGQASRFVDLDLLRVIGIVAVIAGHVWSVGTVRPLIYTWHVPLFFVLSGYLWTRRRPVKTELQKRWRSLAVPYLCWLALIGILFIGALGLTHKLELADVADIVLGGSYIGRPFSPFWFMSALFVAAIAFRLLQGLPLWAHWAIALALLALAYAEPAAVAAIPLGIGTGLTGLVFVVAGRTLKLVEPRIPQPWIIGVVAMLVGIVLIVAGLATPLDMKKALFGTIGWSVGAAVLICGGAILAVRILRPALRGAIGRRVLTLAGVGTTVILTHAVVLWLLRTPPSGSIAVFVLSVVLPWALGLLLVRTPLAPHLVGIARRRGT